MKRDTLRLAQAGAEISARLAPLFEEFAQAQMASEERAAKADPLKHKLSRVMERGKPLSSRHWGAIKVSPTRTVKFCWSAHRNVAGFFVGWREVEIIIKRKRPAKVGELVSTIKRDQFCARRVKKRLEELQKRRHDALQAKHPKKARWHIRYTRALDGATFGLGTVGAFDEEAALAAGKRRWPNRGELHAVRISR